MNKKANCKIGAVKKTIFLHSGIKDEKSTFCCPQRSLKYLSKFYPESPDFARSPGVFPGVPEFYRECQNFTYNAKFTL